jgi:choline dehydrogenase-like flavoprotein
MFIDSRTIEDGATVETEVCVVGAGAAGITLALQLADRPFRVALVESGGLEPDPATEDLARGALNVGHEYRLLPTSRLRYFGGSTGHWGGHCVPLRAQDMEHRPWIPHSGWPISRASLDPYYARAHAVIGLGTPEYDADRLFAAMGKRMLPFDPARVATVVSSYNARRFGLDYQDAIGRAGNLTAYLWGNLVGVHRHPSNPQVDRISVRTLAGNGYSVRARHYVLAMGGIENARMLLLSNDVEPAGLGNGHDLVGRYFMEHIYVRNSVILPADQTQILDLYGAEVPYEGDVAVRALIAMPERLERELEIPAFRAGLEINHAWRNFDAVQSASTLRRDLLRLRWPDDLDGHILRVLGGLGDVAGLAAGGEPPLGYWLRNYFEQTPNPDSRIGLASGRDALGLNRATVDWRLTELDRRGIRKAHEAIAAEVGRSGFGRMRVDMPEAEQGVILDGVNGGAHHMGTTRMHEDPRRGAVDADCRLHGLGNLFLAGSSVFPTGGYANPTLTIVAMTIRLADHLRAQMAA